MGSLLSKVGTVILGGKGPPGIAPVTQYGYLFVDTSVNPYQAYATFADIPNHLPTVPIWNPIGGSGGSSSGGLLSKIVNLSQSDLLNLETDQFAIVPAQGPNTIIIPIAITWKYTFGTQPYLDINNLGGPNVYWENNQNVFGPFLFNLSNVIFSNIIIVSNNTTSTYIFASFLGTNSGTQEIPPSVGSNVNVPLVIQMQVNDTLNFGEVITCVPNNSGTGYIVGDTINFGPSSAGSATVSQVGSGGEVLAFDPVSIGGQLSPGNNLPTVNGSGSGLTVDITVQTGDGTLEVTTFYTVAQA